MEFGTPHGNIRSALFDISMFADLIKSLPVAAIRGGLIYVANGIPHPFWDSSFSPREYAEVCRNQKIVPYSEIGLHYDPNQALFMVQFHRKKKYDPTSGKTTVDSIPEPSTYNHRSHGVLVQLDSSQAVEALPQDLELTAINANFQDYSFNRGFFTLSADAQRVLATISFGHLGPRYGTEHHPRIELVLNKRATDSNLFAWFDKLTRSS